MVGFGTNGLSCLFFVVNSAVVAYSNRYAISQLMPSSTESKYLYILLLKQPPEVFYIKVFYRFCVSKASLCMRLCICLSVSKAN